VIGIDLARLFLAAPGHNALNVKTVKVYFQRSAGTHAIVEKRGIKGLSYRILSSTGDVIREGSQTGKDGMVSVPVPAGQTVTLEILGSQYEVSIPGNLHPIGEMRGVQQRLSRLGYQVGPLHGDNRLANTYENPDETTERGILDFQADNDLFPDAMFGAKSQKALEKEIKAGGGE